MRRGVDGRADLHRLHYRRGGDRQPRPCRPEVDRDRAAYPLYEYDTIIINPQSYTHFLFGKAGEFSNELYELGS